MKLAVFSRDNELIFHGDAASRFRVERALLAASGGVLRIRFAIPVLDLHGYWKPDLFRPVMKLDWTIRLASAGNVNFPFITLFSRTHRNRFCFYSTDHHDDAELQLKMNQQDSCYDAEFRMAVLPETPEFELVFSTEDLPWTELLTRCRESVCPKTPTFPNRAWHPVYCTWYAAHAALTTEYLKRNEALAAELGFGTFIVDDGWSYDEMKRVTPENAPHWYEAIGEWRVSENKLPGFAARVEDAHERNLAYLLWAAPFFIGAATPRYGDGTGFLGGEPGSYGVFDPADKALAERTIEQLTALMVDWKLDGLKLDFLAHVSPDVEHPHGRAAFDFISRLSAAVRSVKPDALIEFRHFYSTPLMMGCGTQFRANDTPFDFFENFQRVAQLRAILGDGVPVHADPACWHPEESLENIALHLAGSMAGVPMVSMELSTLRPDARELVRDSLGFYNEHQAFFRAAHWSVVFEMDYAALVTADTPEKRIAFVASISQLDAALSCAAPEIVIFNLTPGNLRLPDAILPPGRRFNVQR